jgi:pyruvate formate lyase activating enzyme
MNGIVFDIKRFAVHDGPGIRTSVFLKGCPLKCIWCQNPEGNAGDSELWYFENKCVHCYACIGACPEQALEKSGDDIQSIVIDRAKCRLLGACVDACPSGALSFVGREMSDDDVAAEVLKDRTFYETSGGGVTLTGGDPCMQAEFSKAILEKCRALSIHTVVQSCLHADNARVMALSPFVDLFIADLKFFDSALHAEHTGASNEIIRKNFEALAAAGANLLVRIPLIPGYTATEENLSALADYVRETREDIPVELINYNPLCKSKYERLGRTYPLASETDIYTDAQMSGFKELIRNRGVKCAGE